MRAFPWKSQAYSPAFNLVMSMCGTLSARHALYPGVRPCTLNQRRPLVVQATGGRYLVAGIWWSGLVSNQRPPACQAGALPLSYPTDFRTV